MVRRLIVSGRKHTAEDSPHRAVLDVAWAYLHDKGLLGSPLRDGLPKESPRYGYWVTHPEHTPRGEHSPTPLTEADKRNGWAEVELTSIEAASFVTRHTE